MSSGLVRVIWHWSAGTYEFSGSDSEHYHFAVDGNGKVWAGEHTPEDNISTSDDDYAAHVKNLNTGSIGIAVCAMAGAVEKPFSAGKYPIKQVQIEAMLAKTAEMCGKYGITPSRQTTLSHAEVQWTLGVAQDGKWDLMWIPGMGATDSPLIVGDRLRTMLAQVMEPPAPTPPSADLEARVAALEAWVRSFAK